MPLSISDIIGFGDGQSRLFDAYGDYKPDDAFNLRLGKFKVPLGLERLKSRNDITFVEASLPTNLAPNRDIGLMAYGDFIPELSYEVGVFNGIPDLGNENGDEDDNKEFAARLFAHPFKQTDSALKGLGLGVAGTWGEKDGSTSVRQVGDYRTPGQARFFRYATTTFADGEHWRIAPQGYYYAGPFGLLAEYTISNQEVRNGGNADAIKNKAWEVQLSYILTGEDATYKGWPKVANPFDPANGSWGAWEIATKYGELDIDDKEFVTKLFRNVPILDTGARGSTATFVQRGIGDVLLAWENEAFLAINELGKDQFEIVVPSISILAEPPVTVVDGNAKKHDAVEAATAYLEFLYTKEAQKLAAENYYRPSDAEVAAQFADKFPKVNLIKIDAFGGWQKAQKTHFNDGGTFDEIYKR